MKQLKISWFCMLALALLLADRNALAKRADSRNKSCVAYRNRYQRVICQSSSTFELRGGELYDWGYNLIGQLGIGNNWHQYLPQHVGNDSNWRWVYCAVNLGSSFGIRTDGSLWAWSNNGWGQLGIGTNIGTNIPVAVDSAHDWVAVAPGAYHTLALKANGTLWACGRNDSGELGIGNYTDQNLFVQVGTDHDWAAIAAGDQCSFALKANGTRWAWGFNKAGVLGLGDSNTQNIPVKATDSNWVGLHCNYFGVGTGWKADGSLWMWGVNDNGYLAQGDSIDRASPVRIGSDRDWIKAGSVGAMAGLKANGMLWGWGDNSSGGLGLGYFGGSYSNPMPLLAPADRVDIYTATSTIIVRPNGYLQGTGGNASGELGIGNYNQQANFVSPLEVPAREWVSGAVGAGHSLGLYSDGSLWAWGANAHGQLGNNSTSDQDTMIRIGSDTNWTAVAAGGSYSMAMKADGSLWTWGQNTDGQLGNGNNTEQHSPVQVSGTWASVAAGDVHSLALKADGTLWAWGNNSTGQLGTGNYSSHNAPVQVGQDSIWIAIAAGEGHSLGLKADGTLWAWGLNLYGQLGIGNNSIQNSPVQVGSDRDWVDISAGANHSMALKADGSLWTWGLNADGQLGNGNNTSQNSPVQVSGSNWIAMNGGRNHCLAYRADGSIWVWGDNGYGQLGLGNNTNFNTPQQLGEPAIVDVYTGAQADHTGIIKYTRSFVCMAGHNDHGQLGDSSTVDKNTFGCINDCVTPHIYIALNGSDTVCSADTTVFTATIYNGGPGPVYQWYKNNVPVGNNSDTYSVANGLQTGDVIKCVLTANAGCMTSPTDTSNEIAVTVVQSVYPTISIASDLGDTICQELVATYTATITNGGPNPVYHWYENNLPVGSNSPTYVPQQVSGHTIKCVLISSAVCASPDSLASAMHTLVILPVTIPQVNVTVNPGAVITQNQSVTFTANVTNATNPQYQWKKNGSNIAGETQQTYTTTTLQNGDQVACRVRGLSACDTALSAPLTMSVWPVNVANVGNATIWVTVYPNPVKEVLQVGYGNITEGKMELCDMAGKVLIKQPLSHSMDLKGLASGVYMLRVLDNATGYESVHMVVKE